MQKSDFEKQFSETVSTCLEVICPSRIEGSGVLGVCVDDIVDHLIDVVHILPYKVRVHHHLLHVSGFNVDLYLLVLEEDIDAGEVTRVNNWLEIYDEIEKYIIEAKIRKYRFCYNSRLIYYKR